MKNSKQQQNEPFTGSENQLRSLMRTAFKSTSQLDKIPGSSVIFKMGSHVAQADSEHSTEPKMTLDSGLASTSQMLGFQVPLHTALTQGVTHPRQASTNWVAAPAPLAMVLNQLFQSNVVGQPRPPACVWHMATSSPVSEYSFVSRQLSLLAGATTLLLLVFVSLSYLPWHAGHLLYSLNMRG